jgi:integrase
MKLKDVVPLWAEEKKKQVKISSYSAYMLLVSNYILPAFGEKEDIAEEEVQGWVYRTIENEALSKKTVSDILIVLKMILRFGEKRKLVQFNGFDIKYPTSSIRNRKLEVLSKESFKKLTGYLADNFTFRNMGILITLYTGMRIGEVCALKWSDIDVDEGVFRVGRTIQRIYIVDGKKRYTQLNIGTAKTKNSEREIPIAKKLLKQFKGIKKVANEDFYVLTNERKPTEPRTYRNYYADLLRRLEIPPIKFHGLRHTFATYCIEAGADVKTTSVILGHSNVSTTLNIYVHPDLNKKREVIDKIFK